MSSTTSSLAASASAHSSMEVRSTATPSANGSPSAHFRRSMRAWIDSLVDALRAALPRMRGHRAAMLDLADQYEVLAEGCERRGDRTLAQCHRLSAAALREQCDLCSVTRKSG